MVSCILFVTFVLAADEPRVYTLTTTENVWDVAVSDMNLDGNKDILLLTNDETAFPMIKKVALFRSYDSCAYKEEADCVLALPPETGVVMLAEVNGIPPTEIVALHTNGAFVFSV